MERLCFKRTQLAPPPPPPLSPLSSLGAPPPARPPLVGAAIPIFPATGATVFLAHWMVSWLIAWAAMLPIVLLAAPAIRAFSLRLTREERAQ